MTRLSQFSLLALVFATLEIARAIKFTSYSPSGTFTVKQTMWLQFNYDLQGSRLIRYECGIWDAVRRVMVVVAQATPTASFAPTLATKHRVKAFPHNNTFAVSNLQFRDSGLYYCALNYRFSIFSRRLVSRGARIQVEGKPTFCTHMPKRISIDEGRSFSLNLAFCGVPMPILHYHFMPSQHITALPLVRDASTEYLYKKKVEFKSLKRHYCGTKLALWASNSRGDSERKAVDIEVKFKPVQPKIIMAKFSDDGECVECSWSRQESGMCEIKYSVDFVGLNSKVIQSVNSKSYFAKSCHPKILSVTVIAMTSSGSASSKMGLTPFKNVSIPAPDKSTGKEKEEKKPGFSSGAYFGTIAGFLILVILVIGSFIFWRKTRRSTRSDEKKPAPTTFENLGAKTNTSKDVSSLQATYDDCSSVDAGYARYVGLTGRPLPRSPADLDYEVSSNDPVYMSISSKNV